MKMRNYISFVDVGLISDTAPKQIAVSYIAILYDENSISLAFNCNCLEKKEYLISSFWGYTVDDFLNSTLK